MKRLFVMCAAVCLAAAGCGKDSNPTTPTPSNPTFSVDMRPANEVPAITNAESTGSGQMTITLVVTRDSANNITSATASFLGTFTGFPASTALTAAHIHPGVAGTNGGALISLNLTAGQVVFANGSGSISVSGINVPAEQAQAILANPAAFYFNIHTALNPGGVARGQLSRVQ